MTALLTVSLIWAFSFGLIKGQLSGIDPVLVAGVRLLLAWLVFLPFTRRRACRVNQIIALMLIGAIQYGVMYITYTAAFHYLHAYQVALFTIFTPLYVTLLNDLFSGKLHRRYLGVAALAMIGTAVILWRDLHHDEFRSGFLLIQAANACFAFGQIAYTRLMRKIKSKDVYVFSWLYCGALLTTVLVLATHGTAIPALQPRQIAALAYLGILASGVCFFLWNYGARKVNPGTLAAANNLKIPFAIVCSALVFHEHINWIQLAAGSLIIAAAFAVNRRWTG